MSASPPSTPPAVPARPAAQPPGCLPFMVFVLVILCTGGILALRTGWMLPEEEARRTVVEIIGSPSRGEMKAHVSRITSGDLWKRAFASSRSLNELRANVEVSAEGPFITITTYGNEITGASLATAYDDDLRSQREGIMRRTSQAIEASIQTKVGETETARLNWMEIMKKHQLTADGRSPAEEASGHEITSRLAKAKADLLSTTLLTSALKEHDPDKVAAAIIASPSGDPGLKSKCQTYFELKGSAAAPGAPPDAAATVKSTRERLAPLIDYYRTQADLEVQMLRSQISSYEGALQELEKAAMNRLGRRSEMDAAKVTYDSQKALLNSLREERQQRNVKESVSQMYTRVIEDARTVQVPHRFARKLARSTSICSAVLLTALLFSAFAGRLCRRA